VLVGIAIAVKLSSPGPALFRQYRKGMNGEVFSIYKFRSMYQSADKPGAVVQAQKGDARITRVGRFLRSTSLDELPQFLNVLKGEMSVVGPRPHAVEHDEYYKDLVQHYMFRYRIKPGITGWAQVNGFRGETAELEKMEGRVRLDLYYIQNWSFWMDMKIILLTIFKGFSGKNVY
jgi:putative colanic acid biosynthesis UDP-glucose lipid carrier transferase